jgi:putative heme-binding domain-containing protein
MAEEAQWIWSPRHTKDDVPHTSCFFRKKLVLQAPERGEIALTADDTFRCYVNGRHVASGQGTGNLVEHDITKLLGRGRNIVAIEVDNTRGSTAGLAVRLMVKEQDQPWTSFSSDDSWITALRPLPFWNTMMYNDARWEPAREYGRFGETPPWDIREIVAEEEPSTQRFRVGKEFRVDELLDGTQTGSLIAMTFNEFGHILAARDEGPLLLIYDSDKDGQPDRVKLYCDKVSNCQGILALNGDVYVTADGPEGPALYRLSDQDRNGDLEDVTLLLKIPSAISEHGPHGVTLGPDGMIYVVTGNYADPELPQGSAASQFNAYEGDLVKPRYEDPNGIANGRKAPGGMVMRVDITGQDAEVIAGGLRNPYDLAFDREGELFVHDSDLPADAGTPWYRPARLYHVISGGEFGWRSGWAKWPDYYVDSLPGILDTGRGAPSGATFYNHFAFPTRYHNALFLADRAKEQILVVNLKRSGAGFTASSEVFLDGHPLNVMDLAVGPDGHLYFITGGHGTHGGLYRVAWRGEIPENVSDLGEGISAAIRQPQLHSAWGRQKIAAVMKSMSSEDWAEKLSGVARSTSNPSYYRIRALHLMQLFGPPPSGDMLTRLAMDENEAVRVKVAELMGLRDDDELRLQLVALLEDSDRAVRREACEALLRSKQAAPFSALVPLLTSDDRSEAWAARRLLETLPLNEWRSAVLTADDHRLFIQGGLALLIAHGDHENARAVLDRFQALIHDFISDRDFIDMLRLAQVAFIKGGMDGEDFPELARAIGEEFPASDDTMNREIVRLIAHLGIDEPLERCLAFLESDAPDLEKLHLALHLRYLDSNWPNGQRLGLLQFYEDARQATGGESYSGYLADFERDFAKSLPPDEGGQVLARGAQWPSAALGVLYKLPSELNSEVVAALCDLDRQLLDRHDMDAIRLRVGIVAVLGRSRHESAMAYLRRSWEREPERRSALAMGLAQSPDGENFDYLIRSLPVVEGGAAQEVLKKLLGSEKTSQDPRDIRQVILLGLGLSGDARHTALDLLHHWTGRQFAAEGTSEPLSRWQEWYAQQFPDQPPATLPTASVESKWDFDALVHHLTRYDQESGSAVRGASVYETAQCASCHRFGDRGQDAGPELTSVSQRLTKKQILEAILYPSHMISEENAAKTIVTTSGKAYFGIVTEGANGAWIVHQESGEKITVPADHVDEIVTSVESTMREGLLESLTLEQISDLFAYLSKMPSQNVANRSLSDTSTSER